MAAKFAIPTAPAQGRSRVGDTTPHRSAIIISAAKTLANAKKGARWAREISCTSRSGVFSASAPRAARPADSPPGSRAETRRLYLSGASYIRPPFQSEQRLIQRELKP